MADAQDAQDAQEAQKLSVLFVCLGNICRSPMAEAGFRQTAIDAGYVDSFTLIDSCGTVGIHAGDKPDSRTVATLNANGIQTDHRSRQVTKKRLR